MELLAAITALEAIKAPCEVTLHSDSRYLVDAMTKGWLRGWKSRGWSRANNQYLKNADLWKRIDLAATPHKVNWRWVKLSAALTWRFSRRSWRQLRLT